jgi:hypothetical protein
MAILSASMLAALLGAIWLLLLGYPATLDVDPETMDLEESES